MKSLRTVYRYVAKYPKGISVYFLLNILSNIFSVISLGMLSPFLMLIFEKKNTMDEIKEASGFLESLNPVNNLKAYLFEIVQKPDGDIKGLGLICILILTFIILKNIFLYLSLFVLVPIRNSIVNDMRRSMYQKVLDLPVGYFNEQKKGDIMSRLTNDLSDVESSIVSLLATVFKEPVTILIFFAYMIILSPQLTLFLLLFLPVSGIIIGRIGRSLKAKSTIAQVKQGSILSTIEETLGGIRVIKAFNAEGKHFRKFDQQNQEILDIKNKVGRRRDLASPISEILGISTVVAVLWYGGKLVLRDEFLEPNDFLTYILIFSQVIQPLKTLSAASYNIRKGAASVDRIEQLINEDITIREIDNPVELTEFKDCIELRNVSFSYKDKPILDKINLKIKKGQSVALVGSSGAGKSTLADLIPRFHDAVEGEILIDGVDIKHYSLQSLRSQLGIVTQEPILFNDTIANNISLGMDNASADLISNAARVANAEDFILQKPDGYETNIGERGNKLSGGEKQRITIARAVMKNPPILILDEATSSLDTESEKLVQDAINNLMHNRTSIVIAHRLSTIRNADEIIVMKKGRIVERGDHKTLLEMGGFYKRLVSMQEVR